MSIELISQRLLNYKCKTVIEQDNALKEIAQEIALMTLSRAGFFKVAAFQGGTCLRILYGLPRFSEDLDFILEHPDADFSWDGFIKNMKDEFLAYGYTLEVVARSHVDKVIKTAFLKAGSLGGLLIIRDTRTNRPKIQIKLEIDTDPPAGSQYDLKYLDFPLPFAIRTQDQSTLFASKIHAILARPYLKGRDWFDFCWYLSLQSKVNFRFLEAALRQSQDETNSVRAFLHLDPPSLVEKLETLAKQINWNEARNDVIRFIKPKDISSVELWSTPFFLAQIAKFKKILES